MESLPKVDEPLPTPPSYILPDAGPSEEVVRMPPVHSAFSPLPPPPSFSFSPGAEHSTQPHQPVSAPFQTPPRPKFVYYEMELCRFPALTTCTSCQTQVTTQVTYCAGKFAWLMCFVLVLCGLVVGCCLIPFCVNSFKDAHHTCPRCYRVLHVHKKTCFN